MSESGGTPRRSRGAKFVVSGRFDGQLEATVTIDRERGLFSVRPKRRKRTYTLRLSDVALIVLERVIKAEVLG